VLETSADSCVLEPLHKSEPDGEEMSVRLEFPPRRARAVRLTFPSEPVDVEEIRVH
jgi:hypothetical protein